MKASTPRRFVLHVITDETLQGRLSHVELARLAAAGGADAVQYREKRPRSTAELVRTATAMREVLQGTGVRLIVNDRPDVALAAGADGVHLGRGDAPPALARGRLGPQAWIGATAHTLEEARRVAGGPIDYLGVGPVFGTGSKSDPAPELGLRGLARIVAAVALPVVAIGRLTPERVPDVLGCGARGLAVLSAVSCAADPAAATRRFREALDAWAEVDEREGTHVPR